MITLPISKMEENEETVIEESNISPEAKTASIIFHKENVDNILNRGVGTFQALQALKKMNLNIPSRCQVKDLLFLIEQIEGEGDFIEETYITYFLECHRIIKSEFILQDEEEVEPFSIDHKFINDRLSDLQPIDGSSYNFSFTSFLVHQAEITNIMALSDYPALLNISLKSNLIKDISPLSKLQNLKTIDLSENKITELKSLSFPHLETLNLQQNQILYIENLYAPNLKTLNLSQNRIFFISDHAFDSCKQLTELNLSQNNFHALKESCFDGLVSLKSLKLGQNQLKDISCGMSSDLQSLNDLDLSENPELKDLLGLHKLSKLEILDLHKTGIEAISDLKIISDENIPIKYLYIFETPMTDVENVRLELIHIFPSLEEIDETAITINEKQESEQMINEREEALRREKEEQEALE